MQDCTWLIQEAYSAFSCIVRNLRCNWIGCMVLQLFAIAFPGGPLFANERPWQPEDSLLLRKFSFDMVAPSNIVNGAPTLDAWASMPGRAREGIVPSPDGALFFVVTHVGDLEHDANVMTLWVFRSTDVKRALQRATDSVEPVLRVSRPPIHGNFGSNMNDLQWDEDGTGIIFSSPTEKGHREVFRLDVSSGLVAQLTNTKEGVEEFQYRGGRVLFRYYDVVEAQGEHRYPMTEQPLPGGKVYALTQKDVRVRREAYVANTAGSLPIPAFSWAEISPDGRMAVLQELGKQTILLLKFSEDKVLSETIAAAGEGPRSGHRAFWSGDSGQVMLVGAHIFDGMSKVGKSIPNVTAAYDVKMKAWRVLDTLSRDEAMLSATWSRANGCLVLQTIRAENSKKDRSYRLKASNWEMAACRVRRLGGGFDSLRVEVAEGQNRPAALVARRGTRKLTLIPPDPAMNSIAFSPMESFAFRDEKGQARNAGLILPRGFRAGSPVPVVIQVPYYLPQVFRPDGYNTTSDAAQALAARGIAVLMLSVWDLLAQMMTDSGAPFEGVDVVRRVDAVVDALVEQGIADAHRIAMSGFSRGGYEVHYAITHPGRTKLAAAAANDAITNNYPLYLQLSAAGENPELFRAVGRSFWADPEYWLMHDVTFNADKVSTPVLFSAGISDKERKVTTLEALETMGALVANDKPFDYVYLPGAAHQMQWPQQRVALMSTMVDWMSFWLLGLENPDPEKVLQQQRWRETRSRWNSVQEKGLSGSESGFITTRSGMAYKITERRVGVSPHAGDVLTIRYAQVSGEAGLSPTEQSEAMVTLGNDRLGRGDVSADKAGLKGLDECLHLMHPGEKAICIYSDERFVNWSEVAAKSLQKKSGELSFKSTVPHRYLVELVDVDARSPESRQAIARRDTIAGLERAKIDYPTDPATLNNLGYSTMYDRRDPVTAEGYFRWNLALFPEKAAELHDSVAEACLQTGNVDCSIFNYEEALKLNPDLKTDGKEIVARLRADRSSLGKLQQEARAAFARSKRAAHIKGMP